MAKRDTKQLITTEALNLFSQYGYAGVSVKDIAGAVGIKDSSLYKHFSSKQEIFDSILQEMDKRYEATAKSIGVPSATPEAAADFYERLNVDDLLKACIGLFQYFLHDEYASKVRRMLTIEQYKNDSLSSAFFERYIRIPVQFQSGIFAAFQKKGMMRECDAQIAAMHFYGPIYLLLCQCDARPEQESIALEMLKTHKEQFSALYMIEEKE